MWELTSILCSFSFVFLWFLCIVFVFLRVYVVLCVCSCICLRFSCILEGVSGSIFFQFPVCFVYLFFLFLGDNGICSILFVFYFVSSFLGDIGKQTREKNGKRKQKWKQLGDRGLEIDEVQHCNSITQGQEERIPKT